MRLLVSLCPAALCLLQGSPATTTAGPNPQTPLWTEQLFKDMFEICDGWMRKKSECMLGCFPGASPSASVFDLEKVCALQGIVSAGYWQSNERRWWDGPGGGGGGAEGSYSLLKARHKSRWLTWRTSDGRQCCAHRNTSTHKPLLSFYLSDVRACVYKSKACCLLFAPRGNGSASMLWLSHEGTGLQRKMRDRTAGRISVHSE